ncbi:hypothetical protein SOCEGT47_062100 [Sorangium cellulosum]|uniref:Uncharacterized protein n=1 Tax=Sorangium cellulosum TaxID=56 RepID=A0A4P2Q8S4_SORCE|nr:hypothetical protein SOCEGT47_062100 [Sorangium cellulosum]
MGKVGLHLERPGSAHVMVLDREGEQFESSECDLRRCLSAGVDVSFQWWFEEDHSVYCRVRREECVDVVELGMEGCSEDELRVIGEALCERFVSGGSVSVGLVFDPCGLSEDYDWDLFFLRGEVLDWSSVRFGLPKMIGVSGASWERMWNLPVCTVAAFDTGLRVISNSSSVS